MPETILLLATAADAVSSAADQPITLSSILGWVTSFVLAVLGAVLRYQGKQEGRKEERARLQGNVTIDNQPVTTKRVPEFVTVEMLADHLDRIDTNIRDVWDSIGKSRDSARDSLGKVHKRIDDAVGQLNHLEGTVEAIETNVNKLVDIAMGLTPGTTSKTRRSPNKQ